MHIQWNSTDKRTGTGAMVLCGLLVLGGLAAAFAPATALAQTNTGNEARPDEPPDRAAERINEEGKKLVAAGKYEEALDKFRASLKLFPLSNAIFNVGSMLYTLHIYDESHPYLEQTLRAPLDPRQREIVINHLENVSTQLKMSHTVILVESNPPGATISLNGKELPFPTPMRVLVPYGETDITLSTPGFKPETVVLHSTRADPPKDQRIHLARDEPDAAVSVRCPSGSDVFVDGQMFGFELVRMRLLLGPHVVRCGKTEKTAAFERAVQVRAGPNAFEFGNVTK